MPSPDVLVGILDSWAELRKEARVLLVLDISGSMGEPAGDGRTRLDLAQEAAISALDQFKATDDVGLWVFSTELGGDDPNVRELVPLGPIGEQRDVLAEQIAAQFPTNGTPLYDVTEQAYESMVATYDPEKINAIVLLTDGENDDGVPGDDDQQFADLIESLQAGSEGSSSQPVRLFTISYGETADVITLAGDLPGHQRGDLQRQQPGDDQPGVHRGHQQLLRMPSAVTDPSVRCIRRRLVRTPPRSEALGSLSDAGRRRSADMAQRASGTGSSRRGWRRRSCRRSASCCSASGRRPGSSSGCRSIAAAGVGVAGVGRAGRGGRAGRRAGVGAGVAVAASASRGGRTPCRPRTPRSASTGSSPPVKSGPLRERLQQLSGRLDDGIDESWRIARRGHELVGAIGKIDTASAERELAELRRSIGTRQPSPAEADTMAALEAQLASAHRLVALADRSRDRLRLLDARFDELVARTVEVSVGTGDTDVLGNDVDGLVSELESLRIAMEETDRAALPPPGP